MLVDISNSVLLVNCTSIEEKQLSTGHSLLSIVLNSCNSNPSKQCLEGAKYHISRVSLNDFFFSFVETQTSCQEDLRHTWLLSQTNHVHYLHHHHMVKVLFLKIAISIIVLKFDITKEGLKTIKYTTLREAILAERKFGGFAWDPLK